MRTILFSLCILQAGAAVSAQGKQAEEGKQAIAKLSVAARHQLAKSVEDLGALREQIANEKLPLAQQLTGLEDSLTALRQQHDKVTLQHDQGSLDIPALQAQIKARQDELAYIGNVLDEYARSFESKVNVSELQYCGPVIEAAKQAKEDTGLSMLDRFGRQIELASASMKRLGEASRGLRFPGVAVDMQGTVVEGKFAILGPMALFAAGNGTAGLAVAQSGSTKPLIRPLDGALQSGIAPLVQGGEGTMPLDPSAGGALKALVQKTNLVYIFEKGGPIMWPLLVASVLALGTVLERLVFLLIERVRRDAKALDKFFGAFSRGDTEEAIRISMDSKFYVVRALGYAIVHKESSLSSALLYAQAKELKRFTRGLPILDTVITLAPLLGLLGTVTGMMGSFSLIGGDLSAPSAITGGIAEALIATAFGLGIAITALLPFNFLNARVDDARHEIEAAATQLEIMAQSRSRQPLEVGNAGTEQVALALGAG